MAPSTKKPKTAEITELAPKDVVLTLCEEPQRQCRKVHSRAEGWIEKEFWVTRCPKANCSKGRHEISWPVGSGYSNPMKALSSCYGTKEELLHHFNTAKELHLLANGRQSVKDFFAFESATATDKSIYGWIRFIVTKLLPCSVVEDVEFRRVVHLDGSISVMNMIVMTVTR